MQKLDLNEQKYIHAANGKYALFCYGTPPDYYTSIKPRYKALHDKLQQVDLPTFPFIWSDIEHLDAKLGDNTYDFIHISNILDYATDDIKISVLKQLTKRLNYAGRILIRRIVGNYHLSTICKDIEKQSDDIYFINHLDQMILCKYRMKTI